MRRPGRSVKKDERCFYCGRPAVARYFVVSLGRFVPLCEDCFLQTLITGGVRRWVR